MEVKRVLLSKAFLAVLTVLLLLNIFFFIYQQSGGRGDFRAYGDIYHEKVEELSELSWEDAYSRCVDFQEDATQAMLAGKWEYSRENVDRLLIAEQLQAQYEHLMSYGDYLEKIDKDAKKLQAVSLFSDPDSFAYKNTVKTSLDFAAMKDVEISAGHDLAVTVFFEDRWADYSILILICLVCGLFLAERKEGLWPMIYAAAAGRRKLACKRIVVLFAAAWIGTIFIAGTKILLCGWLFHGLDEWNRALQSIPMFSNVPTPLSIGEFWLLYLTVKALGMFLIGLVLWAVLSSISNLGLALCVSGILLGVEFACTAIPFSSMFAPLRYINVFSYVDYVNVFVRYLNLSVFGMLISGSGLVLVIILPMALLFIGLNVLIADKKHPVSPTNRIILWSDMIRKWFDTKTFGGSLMFQEIKKLLILRRGILLLPVLIFVLRGTYEPPRIGDPLDMYLQYYQQKFAGPISDATFEQLEAELAVSRESDRTAALNRLIDIANIAPEGAWLIPTGPYEAIWSNNLDNYHRSTALMAMLFLTLLLAPLASQERHFNMDILLHSSPAGRKKLWLKKQILLFGCTVVVWLLVYGAEQYKTVIAYDYFRCLDAPIYSLELFRDSGWTMTIGQTMALYYGLKLMVMLCAAESCFFLSGLCRKNRDAILLCIGALLVPAALAAIGSGVGEWLSYLVPLAGIEVFFSPAVFIITAIIGIVSAFGSSKIK